MNYADIERAWRLPGNQPTRAELDAQKRTFQRALHRHRRQTLGFLALSLLPLVGCTWILVVHAVSPAAGAKPFIPGREWGVLPLLALPWTAWLVLLTLHLRGWRRPGAPVPISASVSRLLDENRRQRTFYKVLGAVLAASALLLPLIVHQLRSVGKAGDEVVVPAFVVYPLYVACVLIWALLHDRRKLAPRARELETLRRAYQNVEY